jgi:hypothetical protein
MENERRNIRSRRSENQGRRGAEEYIEGREGNEEKK